MKTSVALIGAGNWGKNHVRTLARLDDADLRVVVDSSEGPRERARSMAPNVELSDNPERVLRDPEIQAVVIATPAPTHAALATAALNAGKHVLVEKPLCLSSEELATVKAAAADSGTVLMVGHLLEYHPAVDKLKALVDGGDLGDMRYIYSQRVNLGVVRQDENAWWSLAPHDISVILYLLGQEPVEVAAHGASYLNQGIQDVVFANLTFAGSVMAQVHVSWLDPHKIRKFTVVGDKKMVTFDDMEPAEKVRIYDKGAETTTAYRSFPELIALRQGDVLIPLIKNTEPLRVELQHFIDCIKNNTTPRTDIADGSRVVRVLEAGQRSLDQGGAPVSLD